MHNVSAVLNVAYMNQVDLYQFISLIGDYFISANFSFIFVVAAKYKLQFSHCLLIG